MATAPMQFDLSPHPRRRRATCRFPAGLARRIHRPAAAAWLVAIWPGAQAQSANAASGDPLPAWIWPALLALLLLALLLMAALCMAMLRREQDLRRRLDELQRRSATAAAAASVVPGEAAAAPPAAEADQEQQSFTYTVSHDLRAPIRVVEGFTRILKEDYGRMLDRVGNDHLDRVLGAAARMNGMIDALLALSRLSSQPLARQPVNLSQLATFVADDLRRQSPDREVELTIEDGMQVVGDPILLRIVIENLLGNAWKYTGKCTHAQISFGRHPRDAHTFSICDNGAGFDMRFADRLFGVFQRLHSANDFQGTGVGLASVRRILRRHNGEIWAESEIDQGAKFHFSVNPN